MHINIGLNGYHVYIKYCKKNNVFISIAISLSYNYSH